MKTWAIFGVIGLLLSPNWRVAARGAAAAVVGSLIIYGPFFLFGEVNTFDFHWIVHRDVGPIAPFVTVGEAFGWGGRLFQGLFVVAMGLLSVWWLRPRTTHATWAVPLMLVLARVWTDPVGIPYYWVPVQALTIVGIVAVIKWKLELWRLLLIACLWLLLWPSATWTPVLGVVICALLVKLPADEVLPADDQPNAKEGDVEVPGSPLPPVTTEV